MEKVLKTVWVKREDLCSPPPGPPFAKMRGVFDHVQAQEARVIGVLDTAHSQGGWAVAYACSLLGKRCINFYPVRKAEQSLPVRPYQINARRLGADLHPLPAGRSAILYHTAKACTREAGGYMMPNALKLPETVQSVAAEVLRTNVAPFRAVVVSASSGTIAAGVYKGLAESRLKDFPTLYVHMGYSRSEDAVRTYIEQMSGYEASESHLKVIDEGYAYADEVRTPSPCPFPSNPFYDAKAWSWLYRKRDELPGPVLFWNIG